MIWACLEARQRQEAENAAGLASQSPSGCCKAVRLVWITLLSGCKSVQRQMGEPGQVLFRASLHGDAAGPPELVCPSLIRTGGRHEASGLPRQRGTGLPRAERPGCAEVAAGGLTAAGRLLGNDRSPNGVLGGPTERRRCRRPPLPPPPPGPPSMPAPCPARAEDDATDILEAANQVQLNDRREQAPKVVAGQSVWASWLKRFVASPPASHLQTGHSQPAPKTRHVTRQCTPAGRHRLLQPL